MAASCASPLEVPLPSELDEKGIVLVQSAGRQIVLLKVDGFYRAVERHCPHEGGDLGEGLMVGKHIKCPVHGYIYDLSTGKCLNQKYYRAQVYEVEVEGESLRLKPKENP